MVKIDNDRINNLLAQARQGDRQAFSEIVRIMMNPVVALTYKMTQEKDSALDLAQDTFISAWENLDSFKGESRFYSWIYRIAANKSLNYLKREGRKVGDRSLTEQVASENPARELEQKELKGRILSFMSQLPPQQRLVFELRFYKQLSFEEVAGHTDKALGTVKTLYREAVKKLREVALAEGWAQ
ncbi:MAG: sigma-70 family RNA polymerase sigma factor [Candidatus Zixiibacteriota bacterium]|nr:MAG: sigma-70 family RNA polymerase sigma factor [candidate division Zixibacteria bacterium]